MKEIDFDEWKSRPRTLPEFRTTGKRSVRRRPRNPDEVNAMCKMLIERWQLYLASGKIKLLPGGGYEYTLGQEIIQEYIERRDNE